MSERTPPESAAKQEAIAPLKPKAKLAAAASSDPKADSSIPSGEKVHCHACSALNPKTSLFCRFCGTNLNAEYDIPLRLFDTSESLTTLNKLTQMAPTTRLVEIFLRKLGTPWVEAQFLGDGVKISDKQYPEFHQAAKEVAVLLAVGRMPRIYMSYSSEVVQSTHPTYSMGTNDDPVIILNTTFLSRCSIPEFKFMIAREMGHIKCGHPVYLTTGVIAKDIGAGAVGLGLGGVDHILGGLFTSVVINQPLMAAMNAWYRAAAYKADKMAFAAIADMDLVQKIFAKTVVGWFNAGGLQDKMDIQEFLNQYDDLEESVGRLSEFLGPLGSFPGGLTVPGEFNPGYTMPFAVRRLRELIEYHKTEKYALARKIIENSTKGIYTLPKEVEKYESSFCGFCGAKIPAGRTVCPACGRQQEE
ncbi:MAG: M48 family metallopeptidase [Thaumarchaeota archaeon]|nr:M48 family metallopeptidase [Nitrososphaerota archaeon]